MPQTPYTVKVESVPYLNRAGRSLPLGETRGDRAEPEGKWALKGSEQKVSSEADFCGFRSTMPLCNKQEGFLSNTNS